MRFLPKIGISKHLVCAKTLKNRKRCPHQRRWKIGEFLKNFFFFLKKIYLKIARFFEKFSAFSALKSAANSKELAQKSERKNAPGRLSGSPFRAPFIGFLLPGPLKKALILKICAEFPIHANLKISFFSLFVTHWTAENRHRKKFRKNRVFFGKKVHFLSFSFILAKKCVFVKNRHFL